jgi:nitrite reductase (NO-forming)
MTAPTPPSRGSWALRDRPGLVWLGLAVVVALGHPFVPGAEWLMVHLVLLGALTHSAMVWSTHFTQALLRTPEHLDDRSQQNRRIALLIAGVTAVLVGVPAGAWPLTVVGAVGVSVAVVWHGIQLWHRLRRALRPTMLRTRMDDRAERLARQALPVLLLGLAVLAAGAALGSRAAALAGLLGYAGGLLWWGRALLAPARHAPPKVFATWSVTAALGWGCVALVVLAWRLVTSGSWAGVAKGYGVVAAVVAVGFAAQLLFGALSHLIPTVLGGGPSVVRAGSAWFNRAAAWRVTVVNLGLVVCLLPSPSAVRVGVSVVVLVALAAFVPLLLRAVRAAVTARRALVAAVARQPEARPPAAAPEPLVWSTTQAVAGVLSIAVAVSLEVAADPAAAGLVGSSGSSGSSASAGSGASAAGNGLVGTASAPPTGRTTRVRVEAHDMAFVPSEVSVPYGDRLVVEVVNVDRGSPHDLTFGGDRRTGRIMPGHAATLDVGVVGARGQGWCTIVGHRQMGMALDVVVTGGPASSTAGVTTRDPASTAAQPPVRLTDPPAPGFRAVDAVLPPLEPGRTHEVTLTVEEVELEVAPGVRQRRWTFDGAVPGPTLHGRVGDTFVVTLVNHASMGHSVDFHAGERAPDDVMRTVPPGGSLTYRFTADRAGVWMYHCSTMPMSAHIAAGMHGAVVIEPDNLPAVDRSYVLVQSEVHLDGDGRSVVREVDAASAAADTPDAVVFNGAANQYAARPLRARVGERVRVWVLAAGPNRGSSFHVVGAQFDTVWSEGAYLLRAGEAPGGSSAGTGGTIGSGGSQVLALAPAQGGFVELVPREPGHYPFVTHVMADAERGARGILAVTR